MRCPTCKHKAVRANPEDHLGSEWYACINPQCHQRPWSRGERSPRRERASLVDDLVSLSEEERERRRWTRVHRGELYGP